MPDKLGMAVRFRSYIQAARARIQAILKRSPPVGPQEALARRVLSAAISSARKTLPPATVDEIASSYAERAAVVPDAASREQAFHNVVEHAEIGFDASRWAFHNARRAVSSFEERYSVGVNLDEVQREPFVDEILAVLRYIAGSQKDVARVLLHGTGFETTRETFVMVGELDDRLHAYIPLPVLSEIRYAAMQLEMPLKTRRRGCPGASMIPEFIKPVAEDAFQSRE